MIRVGVLALSLAVEGCMVGTDGQPRVLLGQEPLDGGEGCHAKGQVVTAGVDVNGNGVLDPSEVTSALPLCEAPAFIQSGAVTTTWVEPNWTLAQGTGERTFSTRVAFPLEFDSAPAVVVSLRMVDSSPPQRVDVFASDIDPRGFLLTVRTWEGSLVNGVVASWLAYTN